MIRAAIGIAIGMLLSFSAAAEELNYQVIESRKGVEIRYYPAYLEATVTLAADGSEGDHFRVLAGYIFGGNKSRDKIAMTAPVITEQATSGEKIAMTAPVIRTPGAEPGQMRMSFSMPSAYKMNNLPIPNDPRITLREVPAHYKAVQRYGGYASATKNQQAAAEIIEVIADMPGFRATDIWMTAGYDAPWKPARYRRNEVMLTIEKRASDD